MFYELCFRRKTEERERRENRRTGGQEDRRTGEQENRRDGRIGKRAALVRAKPFPPRLCPANLSVPGSSSQQLRERKSPSTGEAKGLFINVIRFLIQRIDKACLHTSIISEVIRPSLSECFFFIFIVRIRLKIECYNCRSG